MRIAFTHNLKLSDAEDEAEFDTPETIELITSSLRAMGHHVEPVEVSGPASRTVARLEAVAPDLIFNTAEGTRGRFREAFFPALFDRLGMPFTFSDAYICALTLDKQLTKLVLESEGVRGPRGRNITDLSQVDQLRDFRFPVIAKPNFEGSSIGITTESVREDFASLVEYLERVLPRFPSGLLVEEYIVGDDVVVPWLENGPAAEGGVLEPARYVYRSEFISDRKFAFFDLALKQQGFDAVVVECPAKITAEVRRKVMAVSRRVFASLGIRDAGRIDFRVTPEGEVFFLEINALPSLEKGASLYAAGAKAGFGGPAEVLQSIVESACTRYGIVPTRPSPRRKSLSVAMVVAPDRRTDAEHTWIDEVKDELKRKGYSPSVFDATPELGTILAGAKPDLVMNVALGLGVLRLAARVPALTDLMEMPCTGSDAGALAMVADAGLVGKLVHAAGVPTVLQQPIATGKEKLLADHQYPVCLRPIRKLAETATVANEAELKQEIPKQLLEVGAVVIEPPVHGELLAVPLLGERRPKALPAVAFNATTGVCLDPAPPPKVAKQAEQYAKAVFSALGCRDYAMVYLRYENGELAFHICRVVPDLTLGKPLRVSAERAGMSLGALLGDLLAPALRRYRELSRVRMLSQGPLMRTV